MAARKIPRGESPGEFVSGIPIGTHNFCNDETKSASNKNIKKRNGPSNLDEKLLLQKATSAVSCF